MDVSYERIAFNACGSWSYCFLGDSIPYVRSLSRSAFRMRVRDGNPQISKLLPGAIRELVLVAARLVAGDESRVVVQRVIEMAWIHGERLAAIRILAHLAERKRLDCAAVGGVEVHVLFVAVCLEEIIASPAFQEWRQLGWIELKLNFFSGTEDGKFVVEAF